MKKNIKLLILFIFLFIFGALFYKYYISVSVNDDEIETGNLMVDVYKVKYQPITLTKTYVGNIVPINSVSIIPFISGFIDKVLVHGGQNVKSGDVLFVINQAQYKADMDTAYAKMLEAKATFENAKVYYERMKNVGSQAVSKTDIDNAKASYLSSEAQLASAVSNYNLAKINYDYTIISSSIDGVVGDVAITKGDYVSPNTSPLIKIIQFNPIRVVFSIADKEYMSERRLNPQKIFDGWVVKLKLSDDKMYNENGYIKFLDNEISPSTSSIKVYADFPNKNKILVANAYVDVVMEKNIPNGILLPQSAVYFKPNDVYIYVLKGNRAVKTHVVIGQSLNNKFVIIDGVKENDIVILDTLSDFDLKQNIYIKGEKNEF